MRRFLVLLATASLAAAPALAQTEPRRSPLGLSVEGGALFQFDADIDGGGSYSVARAYVEPGIAWSFGPAGGVGLSIGYGHAAYDFSPGAFIGGLAPWDGVHDLRVSLPIRWAATDSLQVFAIPSVRLDWENGADPTDGLTAGAILGASWRVSDSLSIGPGVGIFTGLEEDLTFFPVLFLDWRITETLSLRTGSGLGASRGPGVTLEWQAAPGWTIGIGARYEAIRFRLDDAGPAPGGVGEENAVPVFLTAAWEIAPTIRLTAIAGIEAMGQLSLEDASGVTISERDADPAPFLGLAFRARF